MYPRSLSIATRLDSPQYQSTKATRINYLPPPHLLACHPAAPFTQGQHLVLSLCTDPRFLRASVSTGRIPSGSAEGSCLPDRPRGEAQDHRRACPHAHLLDSGVGVGVGVGLYRVHSGSVEAGSLQMLLLIQLPPGK